MESSINITDLSFTYDNKQIFDHLNLSMEKGKITSLIGSNKCGKTTLIKLIAGLYPTTDKIEVDHVYNSKKTSAIYKQKLGVVFSHPDTQFLFYTVEDELAFPLENLGYSKDEIKVRIEEITTLFRIKELLLENPRHLTIGEKQRVLLSLALIHKPKVLLIDDALSLMDKDTKKEVLTILNSLKEDGLTILIVTNDPLDILSTDYVCVLDKGKVITEGSPLKVLKEDQKLIHIGIEIPFMIDLSLKLKFYDVVDDVILDQDRMVEELWK